MLAAELSLHMRRCSPGVFSTYKAIITTWVVHSGDCKRDVNLGFLFYLTTIMLRSSISNNSLFSV